MIKETMTVHEALSDLKRMDGRVNDALSSVFVTTKSHSAKKINGVDVEDVKKEIQASFDKVSDLIRRRTALKKAITLSNAKTMVTVNGEQFTVAEAIDLKQHGMELKSMLLATLTRQFDAARRKLSYNESAELQNSADNYLVSMFGTKEVKTAAAEIQKAREDFIEMKSIELIDPLKIEEKIQALSEEISAFEAKIDSALSVSNALTTIEIEY